MLPRKLEINGITVNPQAVFRGSHKEVQFKIVNWTLLEERSNWNYYIFIREDQAPAEVFAQLWLEDKFCQLSEEFPKRLQHDYMQGLTGDIDFHGGITYYAKHGHTEGYRCVELGCDYSHYFDTEHGLYDIEEVLSDTITTINDAVKKCQIKQSTKQLA